MTSAFAAYLRDLRAQAGLTQEEVEERSGVPQTTISGLESGRVQRTSPETLAKLASAFGVTRRAMFGKMGLIEAEEEAPTPPSPDDAPTLTRAQIAAIVAHVEAKPDPGFRAWLAGERAALTPEDYEQLCLDIDSAWTSNARAIRRTAERFGGRGREAESPEDAVHYAH